MRSTAPRPKTQSALLEAMQERTVTSGNTTHELEAPFLVMATQNPIEMEGTYPLPEAQLDRFLMKILVRYPSRDELNRIVERTIQNQEEQVQPVLDRDAILEVRAVCRDVLVAPHVQEIRHSTGDGHAAGAGRGARAVEEIHPLRQLAARCAGAGGVRPRAGADARPLSFKRRGSSKRWPPPFCGIASFSTSTPTRMGRPPTRILSTIIRGVSAHASAA